MRKIYNVILNEYIKIFAKISTKIMLVCIVLLAVFWNVGSYLANRSSQEYYRNDLDYDSLINEYSGTDETQADMYRFMKEQDIKSTEDWRYAAITDSANALAGLINRQPAEEEKAAARQWYDRCKRAIADNDSKAYLRLRIEFVKTYETLTEEERKIKLWSLQYQIDHDITPAWSDKRYQTLQKLVTDKTQLLSLEQAPAESRDAKQIHDLQSSIAVGEYVLEHNLETYLVPDGVERSTSLNGFWSVFRNSTMLIMVINVLIIIVAGSMVSMEFSSGTIKFLLINPIKRWKILLAKYLSVLTVGIVMLFIYYVFNLLLAGIFFGFGEIGAPLLTVAGGKVYLGSGLLYVAWKYILGSLGLLTMATFAFAVSSLVRNSALAIGLGVFLLLSGYGAVYVLASSMNMDWARYILFANTDINLIINHQTPFIGHTVGFALIVTGVYMAVFLLTAWDAFVRRDIK